MKNKSKTWLFIKAVPIVTFGYLLVARPKDDFHLFMNITATIASIFLFAVDLYDYYKVEKE